MKCSKCLFNNSEEAKFCAECGNRLLYSSENNKEGQLRDDFSIEEKFLKLQRYLPKGLTERVLSQRERIEGERKQVTVMFCDIVGFTPMVEKLGPEEAFSIMDKVYEILIHEVYGYEGTVNEMTGDGIMALFGAPIALEDAPHRALRSALSIHREIGTYNNEKIDKRLVPPIKLRIGIHAGPVVVGSLGNDLRVEFKAVGDTVNLASRMEGLAEPGTTYVTDAIFRQTEPLFMYRALGKKEVKGKDRDISVYELLSAKEDVYRPRLGYERMMYSKMVGRVEDLNRLELQVMKVINGEGSIVNIIGEAGIGKSRLVAELRKREVVKQVAMFEGRSISIGRNLSFHPIIDILKQWARIQKNDGDAVSFNKLEVVIKRVNVEDVTGVLTFIATLMGVRLSGKYAERIKGIEGEALEKLILKSVRDLLIKASEINPLVIVMEDLHWADTSSIELIESLFGLIKKQKILLFNVFRPNYEDTGDRISETVKEKMPNHYVELILQPLGQEMSEELINNILTSPNLPHTIMNQIVNRASGNPFFIEEVVRSLLDQGVVVVKDGELEVTPKIDDVIIPPTINDVLMSRIDRLEETTRHLVKVASVIGRNFFYRILTEVAKAIEDIDSKLTYLKEVQIINERRRMEELEYLFKHALVQEAAYESILGNRRIELHLKVAESIENVFLERLPEFYGMLAYHYSKGENLEKTEEYLVKAGEEALRSSASSEALNYYQDGLKLYLKKYRHAADSEKIANFEKNIALAFFNKGQYENALQYFDRVFERWGAGSPKNIVFIIFKLIYELISIIINLYFPSKKEKKTPQKRENEIFDLSYKKSITLVELDPQRCFFEFISTLKKLTKYDITQIENGIGMWMSGSGLFSWTGMSFKLSRKILDYNKNIINKNNAKQVLYYDLFELLHNSATGNWLNTKAYDENLVSYNLNIGEFWHVATYLVYHGLIKIDQGAFKEAEIITSKLLEIWEVYGNENATEYWYSLRMILCMKQRKFSEALSEANAGISFHTQTGRDMAVIYYLGHKAMIQIFLKDEEGAKGSLLEAEEIILKQDRVPPIYISGYLMGKLLLDLHNLEQGISLNDRLKINIHRKKAYRSGKRALNNSTKYAFNKTETLRWIGTYYWIINDIKKAIRYWEKSINEAKYLGARVDMGKTYMEVGKQSYKKRDTSLTIHSFNANQCLENARVIFQELDLGNDLEELEKIYTFG
jgi:class 3 adenylate cyclase/tetratricopeptide (TPR) repeat protein